MIPFDPDPASHDVYEYVPASEVRPGDVIVRDDESNNPTAVRITAVRRSFHAAGGGLGAVTMYREPTDEEYAAYVDEHGDDLRAMWISTSVADFPVLKAVPSQRGTRGLIH